MENWQIIHIAFSDNGNTQFDLSNGGTGIIDITFNDSEKQPAMIRIAGGKQVPITELNRLVAMCAAVMTVIMQEALKF